MATLIKDPLSDYGLRPTLKYFYNTGTSATSPITSVDADYFDAKFRNCTTVNWYDDNWYSGNGDIWFKGSSTSATTCSFRYKWSPYSGYGECHELKPTIPVSQRLRDIIQLRQAPSIVINGRKSLQEPADVREICARQTLRRIIGEDDYRNYLKNGFISVRAKSGKVYQIRPAHGMTMVYLNGVAVEKLCVVFKGDFPPTDSLIMRYLIILNDENEFRKHAISHTVIQPQRNKLTLPDQRSLNDIFRSLKAG